MAKNSSTEFTIFKGKSLSDLFEEIYDNQRTKKKRIGDLIEDFKVHIKHAGDVAEVGLVLKDLIKFSIENDEMLIKLAAIAQRIMAAENKTPGEDGFLSDAERKQLLEEIEKTSHDIRQETKDKFLEQEIENVQKKLNH